MIAPASPAAASEGSGPTPAQAKPPPMSAPAIVPRLKKACIDVITGRPYRASTRTPCAFCATSSVPAAMPIASRAAISSARFLARPGVTLSRQPPTPQALVTGALPTRSTRRSASVAPRTSPTGTANSATPSDPSDRCAWALTAGIRAIHTPAVSPMTRKYADTPHRARRIRPG